MNKENLVGEIGKIPTFILRDVAINGVYPNVTQSYDWTLDIKNKAVTEEGNKEPVAFVSNHYKLIQFKDVFLPLIKNISELDGRILYYKGKGLIDVFPEDETLKIDNGKIGITALNSVDLSTSVIIKFSIFHNNRILTIPSNIAGFKRVHSGDAITITQNFLSVTDRIKAIWNTILTTFTTTKINEEQTIALCKDLKMEDKYIKKFVLLKVRHTPNFTLWDFFTSALQKISDKDYKTEYHKRKKIELITEKMFKQAIIMKLTFA